MKTARSRIARIEAAVAASSEDAGLPRVFFGLPDARTHEPADGVVDPDAPPARLPNDPRARVQLFDPARAWALEAEGLTEDEALDQAASEYGREVALGLWVPKRVSDAPSENDRQNPPVNAGHSDPTSISREE